MACCVNGVLGDRLATTRSMISFGERSNGPMFLQQKNQPGSLETTGNASMALPSFPGRTVDALHETPRWWIHKLNSGKSDGNGGLSTDHFKNACDDLFVYVSFLFSCMLVRGTVRGDLLISNVIPIPKGRYRNLTDSNNYRGIALSSVFGKILDFIFLNRYSVKLCTSEIQFGCKAKRSTNHCSMVLKEAIAYYVNNSSTVYCTMLDATKAFYKVEYCKLFRLLISRDLPSAWLRLLLNIYTNISIRIASNGICSAMFLVKNGVKQGGVISPILFCIYLDGLLNLLATAQIGCASYAEFLLVVLRMQMT